MIGVVVAAHGELAQALVTTARLVVPEPAEVLAVGILAEDDTASYEARLQRAVLTVCRSHERAIVLTDMFGGTPSNVGLTLHEPGRVEVLTGANLPMLIKALQLGRGDVALDEAARQVKLSGTRAITVATEVLAGAPPKLTEKSA